MAGTYIECCSGPINRMTIPCTDGLGVCLLTTPALLTTPTRTQVLVGVFMLDTLTRMALHDPAPVEGRHFLAPDDAGQDPHPGRRFCFKAQRSSR